MLEKILQDLPPAKVIDSNGPYVKIDLSVQNKGLPSNGSAEDWEQFIAEFLQRQNAEVAYGGYNEERNLYRRSELFSDGESEPRNVHIGIDLWTAAGTSVLAALDGKVHSFDFNTGLGNYGPTIILEHNVEGQHFYTLYGHLSVESIEDIEIGDNFKAGAKLATLGDASVNGDYAPHLHFQIIRDIEDNFGDYPGVSTKTDLRFYLENCPDPNLLLKLE